MLKPSELLSAFSQLFFPHLCAGCGSDILSTDTVLCFHCLNSLPVTNFHRYENNPVEKMYVGRLPLVGAASFCHFTKDSVIQSVLHQLKYKGNREVGYFFGRMMGTVLLECGRFQNIDALIPLPLFESREKKRGYNQAALVCEGMAEVLEIPVITSAVARIKNTQTQTHKSRVERWQNMEGRFAVQDRQAVQGRHLMLVDDVITTGATLEACGHELLKEEKTALSIYTLAYTAK